MDSEEYVTVPKKMILDKIVEPKRIRTRLKAVVKTLGYAVLVGTVTIGIAIGFSKVTGQSSVSSRIDKSIDLLVETGERADRNAAITAEGTKALRCLLRYQGPRDKKSVNKVIKDCYAEFDRLVKRLEKDE